MIRLSHLWYKRWVWWEFSSTYNYNSYTLKHEDTVSQEADIRPCFWRGFRLTNFTLASWFDFRKGDMEGTSWEKEREGERRGPASRSKGRKNRGWGYTRERRKGEGKKKSGICLYCFLTLLILSTALNYITAQCSYATKNCINSVERSRICEYATCEYATVRPNL